MSYSATARHDNVPFYGWDYWLLSATIILLALGLIMMGSASISIAERDLADPFYYVWRQAAYIGIGVLIGWGMLHVPSKFWYTTGPFWLLVGIISLMLVLIVGKQVNGSTRWIDFGLFHVQPSEFVKLFAVIFLAGYLVRRGDEVRESVKGFLKPTLLLGVIGILLLLEPDLGSGVVIAITAFGMMYLAGVRLWQYGVLMIVMIISLSLLAYTSPYRIARVTSFLNPWADPFNSGFQLTQALIAFGRGDWVGVGLGSSVQKLFYLPEAHTDFLFAVLSEELGLFGGLLVIALFAVILYRALKIGHNAVAAGDLFAGYLAYGLGLLVSIQAFTNIGVNMGVLPTKGLTLPLMSFGGSSIVATCIACAMLLRIAHEYPHVQEKPVRKKAKR